MTQDAHRIATVLVRALVTLVLVCVGLSAAGGIYVLVTDIDLEEPTRFAWSAMIGAIYAALALAAAIFIRAGKFRVLMTLTIVACTIAPVGWLTLVWFDHGLGRNEEEFLARIAGVATIATVVFLHAAAFASLETHSRTLGVCRWALIVEVWIFALLLITLIWFGERLERIVPTALLVTAVITTMMFGAIALLGSLLVRVLFRLEADRRRRRTESVSSRVTLELDCPECAAELAFPAGPGRCACGFSVFIELEEPRCACGYLLYLLSGDACPECGRTVA